MKEYYARICRNDNGWSKPSGSAKDGKNTFFGQYGFGMEEWLFDPRARIKGWQYGFLQPINKGYQQRKGSALALCLFSIPGGGFKKYREEFLIPHCEVLMPAQAEEAITTFRTRLRIDKMVKQVKEVGGDPPRCSSQLS